MFPSGVTWSKVSLFNFQMSDAKVALTKIIEGLSLNYLVAFIYIQYLLIVRFLREVRSKTTENHTKVLNLLKYNCIKLD